MFNVWGLGVEDRSMALALRWVTGEFKYYTNNKWNANIFLTYIHDLITLNNRMLRILQQKPLSSKIIGLYSPYNTLPINKLFHYQILLFAHNVFFDSLSLPQFFRNGNVLTITSIITKQDLVMIFIVMYQNFFRSSSFCNPVCQTLE